MFIIIQDKTSNNIVLTKWNYQLSIHVPGEEGSVESEREDCEMMVVGVEWGSSVSGDGGKGRG